MSARAYRASGKSEPGAAGAVFVAGLVAGVVAGAVEGFVSQWINLLIIFPVVVGAAAGGLAARQVEKRRMRAPQLAGAMALVGAFAGQSAVHVVQYAVWRSAMIDQARQFRRATVLGDKDSPEARRAVDDLDQAFVDDALREMTGSTGFLGYLKMAADKGVTIKRVASSDKNAPTVSGIGTWILWGIEFLIAMGVAVAMAWGAAARPFCERCKRWFDGKAVVASGSADKAAWTATRLALDGRDWPGVMAALGSPSAKGASIVRLERCAGCEEHEPVLAFDVVTGLDTKKARTVNRYRSLLRADEAKALVEAAIARQKAAAQDVAAAPKA